MYKPQITQSFITKGGARVSIGCIGSIISGLPPSVLAAYSQYEQRPRKHQVIASDFLLQHEHHIPATIHRDGKGVPFLPDHTAKISISHTGDNIALMSHPHCQVGIDIESIDRDISHITRRFTTEGELDMASSIYRGAEALFIWSCKECLFKALHKEGVHFKEQLKLIHAEPGEPARSLWEVYHPEARVKFWVNSSIFGALMVSYIDEPANEEP